MAQQWSRESRPPRGDRDHSLPHRSRSPSWRRSRSPRRADDLRAPMSWESQQQQRRPPLLASAAAVGLRRAPFEGGRAPTATGPRCRFFGSKAGCRKGRDCNFTHVTSGQQPQRSQQLQQQQPQRSQQQQQEVERQRLEAVEDEAWRALPPPQPVRHLPRPPPPPPTGPSGARPPDAAHQASSRLEL